MQCQYCNTCFSNKAAVASHERFCGFANSLTEYVDQHGIEWKKIGGVLVSSTGELKTFKYPNGGYYGRNIDGYFRVKTLNKDHMVHRLVAHLFLGYDLNSNNLMIDHIDGDKTNNKVSNLRIVSPRENSLNKVCHRDGKQPGVYRNNFGYYVQIGGLLKNNLKKPFHFGSFKSFDDAVDRYNLVISLLPEFDGDIGKFKSLISSKN